MRSPPPPLALDQLAPAGKAAAEGPIPIAETSPGKIGMWVFLATDAMGFGGLLLAHALLRVRAATWPDPAVRFDRPLAAALTFVLLASGVTMTAALSAARAGRRVAGGRLGLGTAGRAVRRVAAGRLVLATAALGLVFALGQAAEFRALALDRHVGPATDHAAGLFFVIAGYHGLHVVAGVGMLAWLGLRGGAGAGGDLDTSGRVASTAVAAVEVVSLYWQFVDVAWIVIFTALYLVPSVRVG